VIDEFRRLALFTSGVAELTKNRAEQIVREMVKSGEVRRDQASGLVKTALDFSKANRVEFIEAIRAEIAKQVARAGFVSKRDVERLERRIARLEGSGKKTTSRTKKTSRKKPASKRSPAKTAGRKSTVQAPGTGPAETGSDTGFGPPATPDPTA
jgi:polyhydroxyalkanoate synthesis regulator phasin